VAHNVCGAQHVAQRSAHICTQKHGAIGVGASGEGGKTLDARRVLYTLWFGRCAPPRTNKKLASAYIRLLSDTEQGPKGGRGWGFSHFRAHSTEGFFTFQRGGDTSDIRCIAIQLYIAVSTVSPIYCITKMYRFPSVSGRTGKWLSYRYHVGLTVWGECYK
jgi:hypothetical protein